MPLLSPSPPKTKPRIKNSLSNTLYFLLLPQLSHWKQLHLLFSSLHPINIETPPLFCVLLVFYFFVSSLPQVCFSLYDCFSLSFSLLLLLLLFAKIRPLCFFCVYSVVCFFCFNFVWCVFLLSMMCVYSYLTCPIDLMA